MSLLHGWIDGGLLHEQGRVDDDYLVLVRSTGYQRKRGRAAHQSQLDVDTVDQEFILEKHIHVETTYHVDHATAGYVVPSSHEPGVRIGSGG